MISNWGVTHIEIAERFFEYADAYLQAAFNICGEMQEKNTRRTWPNASVCMLLAAHSVELFLKGAILKKSPKESKKTHTLTELYDRYAELHRGSDFGFDMPFRTEYLGVSAEEAAVFAKEQPMPSIEYRYPVDKDLSEWRTLHGFEPTSFMGLLHKFNEDFLRLRNLISSQDA